MIPDHFVAMQAVVVLVYGFLLGAGWHLGNWIAGKIHK
jgi:hypothetical protein